MESWIIELTVQRAEEAGRARAELYFHIEELAYQMRLKELQIASIEPTAEEACDCASCSGWGRTLCPYCGSESGTEQGNCSNCGSTVEP